jgi:UDP-3-O-[3-hydroxymyristoyl] glucosamine N-acyltransferase
MKLKASEIAKIIEGKLEGEKDPEITSIKSLEKADSSSISFLSNPKYEADLYKSQAAAIIVSENFHAKKKIPGTLILVPNPYLGFTALLEAYERLTINKKEGIEQPSFQHKTSTLCSNVYLGAFSYIGKNSIIGEQTQIFPQVFIGDNVSIGNHCIIYAGAKIYANTTIGDNCIIHAGVVIGSDGFGFAPNADHSYHKIPQIGRVTIEDHVDIGANTVIDCGTFDETIIRKGVKLDNLIQVAHNVSIGEHTVIAAQTGISGSTVIGNRCIIGGQVGFDGHLIIEDDITVAAKSGVTKDVKSSKTLAGMYAFDAKDHARAFVIYRRLPELLDRIETIEKNLRKLNRS